MRREFRTVMQGPIRGAGYENGLEYKKADLHLHSHYSYDVLNLPDLSPRALYDKALAKGMGFFTLTDHETMKGILALQSEIEREFQDQPPIPIIPGVEIKVKDPKIGHTVHINILGLSLAQMLDLARRRKNLDDFLAYCQDHDLYHAYNHPFWFERGERATLRTVSNLIDRFPVVELNAGRIPQLNYRTVSLARNAGKHLVATSDSHTGQIAKGYTMAPGETPAEYLRNVRNGVSMVVPHNTSFHEFMEEVRDTIDLVFHRQRAFQIKRTFLRQSPLARKLAEATLRSERVMRPSRLKNGVCRGLRVLAYAPAYGFILQQRKMNWRLGELTSS